MTTENDDLLDRIAKEGEVERNYTVSQEGFQDPTGMFPRQQYHYGPTANKIARGLQSAELAYNISNEDVDITPEVSVSSYPHARVYESPAGHVTIIDDSPGQERMLLMHKSGAGIDIKPDGSIYISSAGKTIHAVGGDQTIIVEGNANAIYNGDLNQKVSGNWNLTVQGNINHNINGNEIVAVDGSSSKKVHGTTNLTSVGNISLTAAESITVLGLGKTNILSKGDVSVQSSGGLNLNGMGNISVTSNGTLSQSASSINIAAASLSVFGSTGTIGGEGIIGYYNNVFVKNSLHGKTVSINAAYATTFHGSLNGAAKSALQAGKAGTAGSLGAGGSGGTVSMDSTSPNTSGTAMPSSSLLQSYLKNSTGAIRNIHIDPDDNLKNMIDASTNNFDASNKFLGTGETRNKLRNSTNRSNGFVESQVQRGAIGSGALNRTPPNVETVSRSAPAPQRPITPLGNVPLTSTKFIPDTVNTSFVPDPRYNPMVKDTLKRSDYIYDGIQINRFYVGSDDKNAEVDKQIAKYLHVQAHYMKMIQNNKTRFANNRLVVTDGVYNAGASETIDSSSVAQLLSEGRAVGYKVINNKGELDLDKTYELAQYWKDNIPYEKIILDYDQYNTDNSLEARVILVMPEMSDTYEASYAKKIETTYNNEIQGNGELIKVTE